MKDFFALSHHLCFSIPYGKVVDKIRTWYQDQKIRQHHFQRMPGEHTMFQRSVWQWNITIVTREHEDNEVDIDEEQTLYVTGTLTKDCINKIMTILCYFYFFLL